MGPKEVIANLNRRVRLPDGYEGRFTGATIRKDESGRVFYQAELPYAALYQESGVAA